MGEFALKEKESVFRYTPINNNAAQEIVALRDKTKGDKCIHKLEREGHYHVYVCNGQELSFYSKKVRNIDGKDVPSMQLTNIWIDVPYEGIAKEGHVQLKGGKKPEKLLRRIIEMTTNVGDLVLDYHAGSGTTAAVAHKLGRRYITMEQLCYGENDCVVRLYNVINGDKTGISKDISWRGGGSFIYCDLAKANQVFIDKINIATTEETVLGIWEQMQNTAFLSWKINIKDIDSKRTTFGELSLADKKRFLIECLDMNMLYVPYSEIDNEEFRINAADKMLNSEFYQM